MCMCVCVCVCVCGEMEKAGKRFKLWQASQRRSASQFFAYAVYK